MKSCVIQRDVIYVTTTAIVLILLYAFPSSAYGQSSVNFLNATNNFMKFSILVPSNWQLGEDFNGTGQRVWFESPDRSLPIFSINTEKVKPYLDTDTMTLKNTSLQQHVQQELNKLSSASKDELLSAMGPKDFKIIRQNAVTVGGNSGWKIELKYSWQDETVYDFIIHTIANGKMYRLNYEDESLKVPERLPIINKMLDSFKVIK
jgi:PsbP